jgi:hypothetical protein
LNSTYEKITVRLPGKYCREDAERLKLEFPGILVVLNWPTFAMEVEGDAEHSTRQLKFVFAWVEEHL